MTRPAENPAPLTPLPSPYPWFGGKRQIAAEVWRRFGPAEIRNYVEPFFGSGAVLLSRPGVEADRLPVETVNDLNGWLANFWRAVAADPAAVAEAADWPVSELDLHARGDWLFYREGVDAEFIERLRADPAYYDVRSAGWWVWGLCAWIGDNWDRGSHNARKGPGGEDIAVTRAKPRLSAGCGVNRQLPHMARGRGVNRQRPHLGDAGRGVNRELPRRGDVERPEVGDGDRPPTRTEWSERLAGYLAALCRRTRRVRICCGDWSRICGPTPTVHRGLTAVFLDPPYGAEGRDVVYGEHESRSVAADCRDWCLAHGRDRLLRIALCGYAGEHDVLEAAGWSVHAWKGHGGYGRRSAAGNANARRERVWFSPHCVPAASRAGPLFGGRHAR